MYYVYLIKSEKENIYIGYSSDLKRRLKEHNMGLNVSTKGMSWELIYYEAYKSKEDAIKRERSLKKHGQSLRWLKERVKQSIKL